MTRRLRDAATPSPAKPMRSIGSRFGDSDRRGHGDKASSSSALAAAAQARVISQLRQFVSQVGLTFFLTGLGYGLKPAVAPVCYRR